MHPQHRSLLVSRIGGEGDLPPTQGAPHCQTPTCPCLCAVYRSGPATLAFGTVAFWRHEVILELAQPIARRVARRVVAPARSRRTRATGLVEAAAEGRTAWGIVRDPRVSWRREIAGDSRVSDRHLVPRTPRRFQAAVTATTRWRGGSLHWSRMRDHRRCRGRCDLLHRYRRRSHHPCHSQHHWLAQRPMPRFEPRGISSWRGRELAAHPPGSQNGLARGFD